MKGLNLATALCLSIAFVVACSASRTTGHGTISPSGAARTELLAYTRYNQYTPHALASTKFVWSDGRPAGYPEINIQGFEGVQFGAWATDNEVLLLASRAALGAPVLLGGNSFTFSPFAYDYCEGFVYDLERRTYKSVIAEFDQQAGHPMTGRYPQWNVQLLSQEPRSYIVAVSDMAYEFPPNRFTRYYVWQPPATVRMILSDDDGKVHDVSVDSEGNDLLDLTFRVDVLARGRGRVVADLHSYGSYFVPRWWRSGRSFIVEAGTVNNLNDSEHIQWFTDLQRYDVDSKATYSLLANRGFDRILTGAGHGSNVYVQSGKWVYFTARKAGSKNEAEDVFRVDPEGMTLEQLTFFAHDGLADKRYVAVSADEKRIAFAAREGAFHGVYVAEIEPPSSRLTRVAQGENGSVYFTYPAFRGGSNMLSQPRFPK